MLKFLNAYLLLYWLVVFTSCKSTDPIGPGNSGFDYLSNTLTNPISGGGVSFPSDTLSYLALGDSYTIGAGVKNDERWPNILVRKMRENGFNMAEAQIVARSGWTTLNLLYAIPKNNLLGKYDMVSLLIGVNNQYGNSPFSIFQREFEALLDSCILYARTRKGIFVLSIPDYGATPFGSNDSENIGLEIDAYNTYIKAACLNKNILYLNVTDLSREALVDPTLLTTDDLHPSDKMYTRWVEKIYQNIVYRLLQ